MIPTENYYNEEMKRLMKQKEKASDHEANMECAEKMFDLYDCYIKAGFTDEQAMKIIITQIKSVH